MKRFLTILLSLAFMCSSLVLAADATYTLTLSANSQNTAVISVGQETVVTLTVTKHDGSALDLYSLQDYLCFNPEFLQYVEGSLQVTALSSSEDSTQLRASPLSFYGNGTGPINRIFINRAGNTAASFPSGSTLLTFRLKALKPGTTILTHDTVEFFQSTGTLLPVSEEQAQVTIQATTPGGSGGGGGGSSNMITGQISSPEEPISEPQPESVPLPFTDISETDWFYSAIRFVYDKKLFTGTTAVTFQPNLTLNRAMLVTVLHRLEQNSHGYNPDFVDVHPNDWYASAVGWAADTGLVDGYPDGRFRPEDPITREQMAALFYRYANWKGFAASSSRGLSPFTDTEQVSPWAVDAMAWSVQQGLISGKENGILDPQGSATRAEAATILMRFTELLSTESRSAEIG